MTAQVVPGYSTHQLWLLEDGSGEFSGALIPMPLPLEGTTQWQAMLDGFVEHAVRTQAQNQLDGLYEVSFWKDTQPELSGLLLKRLSKDVAADLPYIQMNRPLGLLALITDPDNGNHYAVLALANAFNSQTFTHRGQRILDAAVTGQAHRIDISQDRQLKVHTRAIGAALHLRLDEHLEKIKTDF